MGEMSIGINALGAVLAIWLCLSVPTAVLVGSLIRLAEDDVPLSRRR